MPPHIIRLGREPLFGEHKAAFEDAVRRSNGKVHVIVHPNSLDPKLRLARQAGFTVPTFFTPTSRGIMHKTYKTDDFSRAFADRYNPEIQRILSKDEPKIIFAEESRLGNIEDRVRDGWMLGVDDFSGHMGEEAKGMLRGGESKSTVLIVPTPDNIYVPHHGWEPLEGTLAGVDMPKKLEISGTWMVSDPESGEVLPACPTEIRDRLRNTANRHNTVSVTLNRAAGFPDVEGLQHEKHSYLTGKMRGPLGGFYSLYFPHVPGADTKAIVEQARKSLTSEAPTPLFSLRSPQAHRFFEDAGRSNIVTRAGSKVGRNDPCPCGSGLKYKRCHGG